MTMTKITTLNEDMQLNCQDAADFVERYSEDLIVERLGCAPSTWYCGGSAHNDDRLFAEVADAEDGIGIWVKDSGNKRVLIQQTGPGGISGNGRQYDYDEDNNTE